MFERISYSWELVKASAAVLRDDKELIVFPIISMIGAVVVTISFAVPMFLAGIFDSWTSGQGNGIFSLIVAFLFYVVVYTVSIFSSAALVGAAMIRLRGGDPTVSDGFRIARDHLGSIVVYALIAATVGMVLRFISERGGVVGQIVSSILGFAWNVVTFLVVPVLVVEDVSPVDAIKRSGQLLRETWGEQLIGSFSIGLIFGLLSLAVILVIGVPMFVLVASTGSVSLLVLGIVLLVLALVFLGLINSALNSIYAAAVYRYAAEGDPGGYFPPELVQGAFRRK